MGVGVGIGEKIQCLSLWLMHKTMTLSHETGALPPLPPPGLKWGLLLEIDVFTRGTPRN